MLALVGNRVLLGLVGVAVVSCMFHLKTRMDDSAASAAKILKETPTVTSTLVGPGPEPTIQGWAYCRLRRAPEPAAVFRDIFAHATPAGKTYALFALTQFDPEVHGAMRTRLDDGAEISTGIGCYYNVGQRPTDVLRYMNENSEFFSCDVADPSRSISLWVDMDKPMFDKLRSVTSGRVARWLWRRRIERPGHAE